MSSQVMARLRESIVSGELTAGAKINLDQAKLLFQISLSPLREALARLIAEGLVQFEDNRGYRVAPVSLANFEEIAALREEFEIAALKESIRNGAIEWEGNVMRALYVLNHTQRDVERVDTFAKWEMAHRSFHLTLFEGAGKPIFLNFLAMLMTLNDRYRRTFLTRTLGDRDVVQEHSRIAEAAVARDEVLACARLQHHLSGTSHHLRQHLNNLGMS